MMADIYKSAYKVVIWLGQEDHNTGAAFEVLKLFARVGEHRLDLTKTRLLAGRQQKSSPPPTEEPAEQISLAPEAPASTIDHELALLPRAQSTEWKNVLSIFSRSWFSRMWTFQEAALGSQFTELRCGRSTIEANALGTAMTALNDCGYTDLCGFDHPAYKGLYVSDFLRPLRSSMGKHQYRQALHLMLAGTRFLKCSNAHDKVYAVLGLCKPSVLPYLRIDYTQSLTQLYGAVVKASISTEKHLNSLQRVQPMDSEATQWPSWIPDFNDPSAAYGFDIGLRGASGGRYYLACGKLSPTLPLSADASKLTLRGLRFWRVTRLAPLRLGLDYTDSNSWHAYYQAAAQQIRVPLAHKDSCSSILAGDYLTWSDGASNQNPTDGNIFAAMIRRVMTADAYPRTDVRRHTAHEEQHEFPRLCAWRDRGCGGDVPLDVLVEHTAFQDRVMRSRFTCIAGDEPDDAYLCVAAGTTKIGDWVCVLFGGDAPFILREKKSDTQDDVTGDGPHWQFIGECFVEGIMDGEALLGKTEADFETFVLV